MLFAPDNSNVVISMFAQAFGHFTKYKGRNAFRILKTVKQYCAILGKIRNNTPFICLTGDSSVGNSDASLSSSRV